MASYRNVIQDILTSLKQQFDDREIMPYQVLYWVQVVADKIRADEFRDRGELPYLSVFTSVEVHIDAATGRKYIDLPANIMDLDFDKGIQYISVNYDTGCCCTGPNWAQVQFSQTTPAKSQRLYWDPYEKPSPSNPFFYRVGESVNGVSVDRVYFLGFECVNLNDVEIGLLLALDPTTVCNLDDEVPIPADQILTLIKEVSALGAWVTRVPKERVNDGTDESNPVTQPVPPTQQQLRAQQPTA